MPTNYKKIKVNSNNDMKVFFARDFMALGGRNNTMCYKDMPSLRADFNGTGGLGGDNTTFCAVMIDQSGTDPITSSPTSYNGINVDGLDWNWKNGSMMVADSGSYSSAINLLALTDSSSSSSSSFFYEAGSKMSTVVPPEYDPGDIFTGG